MFAAAQRDHFERARVAGAMHVALVSGGAEHRPSVDLRNPVVVKLLRIGYDAEVVSDRVPHNDPTLAPVVEE
jgi:hypothetical protein